MLNHLITIEDTSVARINRIMETTDRLLDGEDWVQTMHGRSLANLFLEPSTRTRIASELAMKNLGGDVINLIGESTSMEKDEDLRETLCAISQYTDIIALRTNTKLVPHDLELADVPVINMGDGDGTHPTQAISDLYTIKENFPKLQGLNVLVTGDCKNSRAIHSFVAICLKYDMRVLCHFPKDLELPYLHRSVKEGNKILDNKVTAIDDDQLEAAVATADVIYTVRYQKERNLASTGYRGGVVGTNANNYASRCGIKEEWVDKMSRTSIILHPFPRGTELPKKFDKDRRAAYFQQMRNKLYVNMGILEELLNPPEEETEE